MSLEIKITGMDLFQKKLNSFPAILTKEARITIKEQIAAVRERASQHHKYEPRGHMLNKSYIEKYPDDFTGILILDKTHNVPYSYAIHEGRKDWPNYKPDRFVDEAAKNKKPSAERALRGVVSRALKKAGLN